ncbi:MAG: bifunctional riboflavin kinase/FAD synthetase [Microcoleus vaginatus WJT46-NPBG5]|jgi:riboflavin kinase/FMN adenylyltransferase|nr:bifunctional riboflavin kinase/FAD synthetase [Microcoleus vaginatus WJT46-NPBG5]
MCQNLKRLRVLSSLTKALTPTAIALGNFDGVHRGHQQVVRPILNSYVTAEAFADSAPALGQQGQISNWELASSQGENLSAPVFNSSSASRSSSAPCATVVTFHPHPQEFFTGQHRPMLTPLDEKVACLQAMGVEQLVLLPFNQELADLSPQQFVEDILVRQLKATQISVGQDYRFGHKRAGTVEELSAFAAKYGITVTIVPLKTCEGGRISSSNIRQALQQGDLLVANKLLGRSYSLVGPVVIGQQLGRTIGFPTANLQLPQDKFLPRYGVYAVRVWKDCHTADNQPAFGVMNIGCRPTVEGKHPTVEVHLLDWSGDLYGQTLTVSLEQFLRPEQKFPSIEALKDQIQADCIAARSLLMANC